MLYSDITELIGNTPRASTIRLDDRYRPSDPGPKARVSGRCYRRASRTGYGEVFVPASESGLVPGARPVCRRSTTGRARSAFGGAGGRPPGQYWGLRGVPLQMVKPARANAW